jgi:ankyrin repeat protein
MKGSGGAIKLLVSINNA